MIQKQSKKLGLYNKYHLHVDTSIGIKHKKDYCSYIFIFWLLKIWLHQVSCAKRASTDRKACVLIKTDHFCVGIFLRDTGTKHFSAAGTVVDMPMWGRP